MASQTEICNMALSHIRDKSRIQSIDENSPQAQQCKLVYDTLRDAVLMAHDWRFASKVVTLALHSEDPPADWVYRYGYPSDCVGVRELLVSGASRTDKPLPFEIGLLADGSEKTILADDDGACARYTMRVTDEGLFDAQFVVALTWRLAAEIAAPLSGNLQYQERAFATFRSAILDARATDASEGHIGRVRKPGAISARG